MKQDYNELDIVSIFIEDAQKQNLASEVVYFALKYMKENPTSTIEDAMGCGYWEWCK